MRIDFRISQILKQISTYAYNIKWENMPALLSLFHSFAFWFELFMLTQTIVEVFTWCWESKAWCETTRTCYRNWNALLKYMEYCKLVCVSDSGSRECIKLSWKGLLHRKNQTLKRGIFSLIVTIKIRILLSNQFVGVYGVCIYDCHYLRDPLLSPYSRLDC